MRKAVFAVGRCLSVTFTYFIQTAKNIVKRLSRPSSHIIPVFLQTLIHNRGPQNPTERLQDGECWATGRHQLAIISSGMLAVTHPVADKNDGRRRLRSRRSFSLQLDTSLEVIQKSGSAKHNQKVVAVYLHALCRKRRNYIAEKCWRNVHYVRDLRGSTRYKNWALYTWALCQYGFCCYVWCLTTMHDRVTAVVVVVEMNIIKVSLSHFCCRTTVIRRLTTPVLTVRRAFTDWGDCDVLAALSAAGNVTNLLCCALLQNQRRYLMTM